MKLFKRVLCGTLSVILASGIFSVGAEEVQNHVVNGNFTTISNNSDRAEEEHKKEARYWNEGTASYKYITFQEEGGINNSSYIKLTAEGGTVGGTNTGALQTVSTLEQGKKYVLKFWFKTDATTTAIPCIRLKHTFRKISDTTKTFSATVGYFSSVNCNLAGTLPTGLSTGRKTASNFLATFEPATYEGWIEYSLPFEIPNYTLNYSDYEYAAATEIQLGFAGSYKTVDGVKQEAYIAYDDVSLVEYTGDIKVLNPTNGDVLSELPKDGSDVKVSISAGQSDNAFYLVGLFKNIGDNKLLDSILVSKAGTSKHVLTFPTSIGFELSQISPITETIDLPELGEGDYSLSVLAWNTLEAMTPITNKAEISTN